MAGRRAPIGRLVDLAVAVPTCTVVAAARAVPIAARVGTTGAANLVGRISEAVHERRHELDAVATTSSAPPDAEGVVDSRPGDTVAVADLPIEGYDDLAARQVVDRLGALELDDLRQIEAYERSHRTRSTVLGKISMLLA